MRACLLLTARRLHRRRTTWQREYVSRALYGPEDCRRWVSLAAAQRVARTPLAVYVALTILIAGSVLYLSAN